MWLAFSIKKSGAGSGVAERPYARLGIVRNELVFNEIVVEVTEVELATMLLLLPANYFHLAFTAYGTRSCP